MKIPKSYYPFFIYILLELHTDVIFIKQSLLMVSEWNILYEHSSHPAVVCKMIKLFLVLDLGTMSLDFVRVYVYIYHCGRLLLL